VHVPRLVLTDEKLSDDGSALVNCTPLATEFWLFLIWKVKESEVFTAGLPFWAKPLT
jgi:hypothetical protein